MMTRRVYADDFGEWLIDNLVSYQAHLRLYYTEVERLIRFRKDT